jgi:crossover junction endodeoxyribonuclease RusA
MITLEVHGEPAPQGSKSVGRHGGVYEKSRKVKPWRDAIVAAVLSQYGEPPFGSGAAPVSVLIRFYLPRPAGHYGTGRNAWKVKDGAPRYPATRPDIDKLARSTLDGLKQAGVYADDGQVVTLQVFKVYAPPGVKPGASIKVWDEE